MPRKVKTRKFYRKRKSPRKAGSKSLSFFIFILGLMVIAYTFSFVKRLTQTEAVGSPEPLLIRLQILNGCGVPGAAQDVAEFLLTQKSEEIIFDIIDVGNFAHTNVSKSLIWDRVGDETTILKVAQLLGIKKDDVSYHLLRNNYLDIKVTLILGSDYQEIFREEKP